jgi:hypothetical protein
MKVKCNIVIDFKDEIKSETVLKSIEVDNYNFVNSRRNGKKLEAFIESNSISSLIHTLDDLLSCISVAEKIVDKN